MPVLSLFLEASGLYSNSMEQLHCQGCKLAGNLDKVIWRSLTHTILHIITSFLFICLRIGMFGGYRFTLKLNTSYSKETQRDVIELLVPHHSKFIHQPHWFIRRVKSGEICCSSLFISLHLPSIISCQRWMICSLIIANTILMYFTVLSAWHVRWKKINTTIPLSLDTCWIRLLHRTQNANTKHSVFRFRWQLNNPFSSVIVACLYFWAWHFFSDQSLPQLSMQGSKIVYSFCMADALCGKQ